MRICLYILYHVIISILYFLYLCDCTYMNKSNPLYLHGQVTMRSFKLRKMMEYERKLLKLSRIQYKQELQQKTELEILLKQAVGKVYAER